MKKSTLAFLFLPFLLVGCSNPETSVNSSSNSEPEISDNTSSMEESSSSSEENSSIESSSSIEDSETEEDIVAEVKSIKEVKTIGETMRNKQEAVESGVYVSETYVEIKNLQLMARLSAIAGGKKYAYTYKLLMSDGVDYIYVGCTQATYENLDHDYNVHELYTVKGYISLYNDEVEVYTPTKPIWNNQPAVNWDEKYFAMATSYSIPQIYDLEEKVGLNVKGVGYGGLVKFKAKIVSSDIGSKNIYAGQGDNIMNIHSNSKLLNQLNKDGNYEIVGALNIYNFRPGLEFVAAKTISEDIAVDFSNAEAISFDDLYKMKYEINDKKLHPTDLTYFHYFEKARSIEGYVNYYLKDGKEYGILEKDNNPYYKDTYTAARDNKAMFMVNEEFVRQSVGNNSLGEYVDLNCKVTIFPYLWNSQKYPQCYVADILPLA